MEDIVAENTVSSYHSIINTSEKSSSDSFLKKHQLKYVDEE